MRVASTTVRMGAAAWITAASPESIRVSAKASSQNGTALLSVPRTRNGTHIRRTSGKAPRDDDERHEHREADEEPAEYHDRRLDLLHADLDEEERRAPDRCEREEEGEVAAMHRATLVATPRVRQPRGRADRDLPRL